MRVGDIPGSNGAVLPCGWTIARKGEKAFHYPWRCYLNGHPVRDFRSRRDAIDFCWMRHRADERAPKDEPDDVDPATLARLRAAREEAQR